MFEDNVRMIERLYDFFNARDIDGVLDALADDVEWANAMDGGHEHGREAVRAYWTRQWAIVSPNVKPVAFSAAPDGALAVDVEQTIYDLNGVPPEGKQGHKLSDKTVRHVFRIEGGKVTRFDAGDPA
ncbi:nuclear transport factor 2 family protein [Pararhizobium antarcticum]|uniref:Ketosteroid isomerase n=1 Tax=Pararhizobium antarcticum TaxID=1798805 RepID=A0A657LT40_9HYPH|nr:nuclear transport factor 2 family protein [Pararhizobium antarcticum]OJF96414.1 ketosteroid isomerase [Pararhizobium antarcticum]OJF96745.1 ketosteroid isomerase [Rhizobium sp. 58]